MSNFPKINNIPYEYQIQLSTDLGETYSSINPKSILLLNIQEELSTWYIKGEMLLFYGYINKHDGGEEGPLLNFRCDGLDLISLKFAAPQGLFPGVTKIFPDWGISRVFSVYDIEEVKDPPQLGEATRSVMKILKLRFHDFWYQWLRIHNIPFSNISTNLNAAQSIEAILKDSLSNNILGSVFNPAENLDPTFGSLNTNVVPFTAPSHYTAMDCIEYLLDYTIIPGSSSIQPQIPILACERGKPNSNKPSLGYFTLKPLGDYFTQAENLQIERYYIREYGNKTPNPAHLYFAPQNGGDCYQNYTTSAYHHIKSYELLDMMPMVNSEAFTPITVCSVDQQQRTFNLATFTPEAARNALWEQCGSKMLAVAGAKSEQTHFIPTVGEDKKQRLNRRFLFEEHGIQPGSDISCMFRSMVELMKIGIFQSTALYFRVPGLPNRKAGRFIGVDFAQGTKADDYSGKLCGQWFIVQVNHVINDGAYWNDIIAVRLHRSYISQSFATKLQKGDFQNIASSNTTFNFKPLL